MDDPMAYYPDIIFVAYLGQVVVLYECVEEDTKRIPLAYCLVAQLLVLGGLLAASCVIKYRGGGC
jgi:hypothetical protein